MINILCYGDSNTWGAKPRTVASEVIRFGIEQRWTGVLQSQLGNGFRVIEEGLRGRTTIFDDPVEGEHKNGCRYLLPCLESHQPVELVVLFLGTNDLKARFGATSTEVAGGIERLMAVIVGSRTGPCRTTPEILLLAPPCIGPLSLFAEEFDGAVEKSLLLGPFFEQVAARGSWHFLNVSTVASASECDGIHLDEPGHRRLGEAIAVISRKIFTKG